MNFPKPKLSRDEAMQLWISERSGYAKEQIVLNSKGVIGIVLKSLNLNPLDEDLFSIGLIGIAKAVNTFNPDKGVKFSTYAAPIIRNEILMTLRKKRIFPAFSLDDTYLMDSGNEVTYGEMIADKKRFEEEVETATIVNLLTEKERKILYLYAVEGLSQGEIAKIIGVSQSLVSRILKKIQKKLEKEFDY